MRSRSAVALRRTLSLPAHFALLSGVVVVIFGVLLGTAAHRVVADRAETGASRTAELVARVGIAARLTPADLAEGAPPLDEQRVAALHAAVAGDLAREQIAAVTVADEADRPVWSSAVVEDTGDVLTVTVPLRAEPGADAFTEDPAAPTVGRVVVAMAYRPVAESISRSTRRLDLALAGGLAALWAMSVGLVASASQRLRREAADHHHQARHDALTGLPNRIAFRENLDEALAAGPVAVALLDLDRFKEINDTLGHHHGDELLVQVGRRLGGSQQEGGPITVARLGGDEFAVLLRDVTDPDVAVDAMTCLIEVLDMPIEVDGLALEVGGSAGLALAPAHGRTPDELLQRADVAMYLAKADRTAVEVYDPDRDTDSSQRLAVAHQVRLALEEREIVVHYRPTLDLRSMQVVGAEAVVRWHHPRLGVIAPEEFMPIVETTGLARPLADYVLGEALRQVRDWRERGLALSVTVTLSASGVLDFGLAHAVGRALEDQGLAPDALVLQVPQATLLADRRRAAEVLGRLGGRGIRVAVGGVSAATLAQVDGLPVHEVAIAPEVVAGLSAGGAAAVVARFTVEMAGTLGLPVLASGVEDLAVLDRLAEMGCDRATGDLVAPPGPAAEVEAVVRSFASISSGVAS